MQRPETLSYEPTERDLLANALKGEYRSSPKVQAIADWATLVAAESNFMILKQQKSPNISELMEVTTEKAAIKETIRKKKFGEDAEEYTKEFNHAGFGFHTTYLNKHRNAEGGVPKVFVDASKNILVDLEQLNSQLPKKEDTPSQSHQTHQ